MLKDGRTTDAGVTGILIAHLGAKNIKDPQKKYRLETVSKIFYWIIQSQKAVSSIYICVHRLCRL